MKIMYKYTDKSEKKHTHFPDDLLHEDWAKKTHGQTLTRLNERGGLSPCEIILNVKRLSIDRFKELDYKLCKVAINQLIEHHNES